MGQMPLHVAQGFIERPDRNVGGALGIQLTHRGLSAGVCPQDPCVGGEATGFTKVAHLRPLVGALLTAAVQLRDSDDGDLELLGQELEGTGELGDLLLPALDAFARAHQLQVVDDHQTKVVLLLEATALGPDLHERHVRRIINEQRGIRDLGHGPRQPGPVLVAHRALAHVLQLDGRLGRQQSHRDLGATHLEAEEHGGHLVLDRRRPGYIQTPRRVVRGNHGLTCKVKVGLVIDLNATHRDRDARTNTDQLPLLRPDCAHPGIRRCWCGVAIDGHAPPISEKNEYLSGCPDNLVPADGDQPLVLCIGDDHRAVGELDLEARATRHHLGCSGHHGRASVAAEHKLANRNPTHRGPARGCGKRRVQCQRLPDGRPRRHDDHLPRVQAVGQVVEVGEPGGDSGHLTGLARGGLDLVDRRLKHLAEERVVIPYAVLGDVLEATVDEIEAASGKSGEMTGVPTGFTDFDNLTDGRHAGQMIVGAARPAVGKALALDTPLPTPSGWTTMGGVAVGELVLGGDGRPTMVTRATEVMTGRPCFEVEFSDGAVIVADAEHQWLVTVGWNQIVRTTAQILVLLADGRGVSIDRNPAPATSDTGVGAIGAEQWKLVGIRPGVSVPVRCIEVDNETHLYLAGESMIPTHNSTWGLDIARSAAIKHKMATVLFSLEMSRTEITMRLLSAEASIQLQNMRKGTMRDEDWTRLARTMAEVSDAPLFIDDSPNMSLMEIRAKCRRLKQQHNLRLVIIDYLQLMSSGKRVESRQQEVSEFSRALKLLAKELEVPVIAISQLNRGAEQRTDKRPQLSDLRESGSIEQDSDLVVLLH